MGALTYVLHACIYVPCLAKDRTSLIEHPPLLLAQFPVQSESLLEGVLSLERALRGYWSAIEKHNLKRYAYLR